MKAKIAVHIRMLGFWLMDFFCNIADLISESGYKMTDEEIRMSVEAIGASIDLKRDNPCHHCGGEGAEVVSAGTDVIACAFCAGTGLDFYKIQLEGGDQHA